MKIICFLTLVGLFFLASCHTGPTTSKLTISLATTVSGKPLLLDGRFIQLASGTQVNVSLLKYYVSNIELGTASGKIFKKNLYHLVNLADVTTQTLVLDSVANETYTSLKFMVGIDAARNHNGAQDGDLDPIHGMIWNWNTGYIFYKSEGRFIKLSLDTLGFIHHFGTDEVLPSVSLPINLALTGEAKASKLTFDLDKLYKDISFQKNPNRQSVDIADTPWKLSMKSAIGTAFSFN
jgi:hypothetical protein